MNSLGEGLNVSASSMAAAGNDIHQTLAILNGAVESSQSIDELSNSLRIASLRLNGMKDELQSIGKDYKDVGSVGNIQAQISNLTNGSVNILADDGSLKSTYDQLKEISEIYFDLSDANKTGLTEIMFGKSNDSQGVAILQAFQSGQIQKAYEASVNSTGSAMEEQEKYERGIEYSLKRLESTFQTFSNHVLDSSFVKGIVDFGNKTIEVIDKIISKFDALKIFSAISGGILGMKGLG